MKDVLTKQEMDALLKELEKRAQEELDKRIAAGQVKRTSDIAEERVAIDAEIATPEEIDRLRATLEHLRDALEQAEARYDPETSPQEDLDEIRDLRERTEELESALDKYDPS